jgi:diguanylate cyclase (GGDEF)-like protein/PAS domain S-box-containing protein
VSVDESLLARLLTEQPDAAVVVDGEGRVLWVNRAATENIGRPFEEAVGASGLDFVHPEDLELVLRSLATIHEKDVGLPIEVRLRTATGWRLMEMVGAPMPWFAEQAVHLTLRDLTDRRHFELAHDDDARLRSLVENSASVTALISPDGHVSTVSGVVTRVLGHDPEAVVGQPLAHLVHEEDRWALESALARAAEGATAAGPVTVRLRFVRHGDGRAVPFELAIVNLVDDPVIGGYVVSGTEITEQVHAEDDLRHALSLLTATLDATADGILVLDQKGRIVGANRRFSEFWRLPDDDVVDAHAFDFILAQLVSPIDFAAELRDPGSTELERRDVLECVDGRAFEWFSRPQRVDGVIVGRVWSFRDVTDRRQLEKRLSYQAYHDPLTGLGNRALFQDRLEQAMARIERNGGRLAVLFVDLDNLKLINDSLGHPAGDALLKATAEALRGCLRKADGAARLGGDEFGVVLEDFTHRDEVIRLVERILVAAREPVLVADGGVVQATVSVGLTFHRNGADSQQLLRDADRAMYSAKARGRNRYAVFGGDDQAMEEHPMANRAVS